ncbi:hypothetical protein CAPN002_00140 [Capnocytophaga stomatis]|uniref:hypothetical protein n=1 Tax=Capnocytophaga stomatis TaxID=1848904 RepID=UPI00194E3C8F|nr:hypothetical protein [Capnocytophaga stomatis]GIJ92796.1 hypothetical protein CAPN002_00140 [Capnocytophaga stomatis]
MKKYVLKAVAGIGEPEEQDLNDWNEDTFNRYQNNELSEEENAELITLAHDLTEFECWVEEIEEN